MPVIQSCVIALSRAALLCLGGPFAHAWKPAGRRARAGGGWYRARKLRYRHRQFNRPLDRDDGLGARRPWILFRLVLGHLPLQVVDVPSRREAQWAVPRGVSPQRQILRSAGGVPVAGRQPAGGAVSDRLRGADRAASSARAARHSERAQSARARGTSYLEEPE